MIRDFNTRWQHGPIFNANWIERTRGNKKDKKKQIEEKKKIEGIVATHDKLVAIYKMITTNECNLV